jgi:CheY-like chemotaxis protein
MNPQISVAPALRILIIDDDDVLRRWLRTQLQARGCEVWEESQGDEALARYRRSGPWDFVLSDLYFYPGEEIRNGLDLMREILLINPQQRSVIHTYERKVTAPCFVLQKPYTIRALLKLLRIPVSPLKVDE